MCPFFFRGITQCETSREIMGKAVNKETLGEIAMLAENGSVWEKKIR